MKEFIVALRKHPVFGEIFSAYFVEQKNVHAKEIISYLTFDDVQKQPELFTDVQKEILKIISSYSDQNLVKIFTKKKSVTEFLKSVSAEEIEKRIRPFIEKFLYMLIDKIQEHKLPFYQKNDNFSGLYEDDRIVLLPDPADAVLNIEKTENGTLYSLSIKHANKKLNLFGKNGLFLCNSPCRLVMDNCLYKFNEIDGKKLKPFFEKTSIHIPKATEKKWFETFARKALKQYEVNATGFQVIEKTIEAFPEIRLETDWTGDFAFVLYFKYGNDEYQSNKTLETKLEFCEPDFSFVKFTRDGKFEKSVRKKLSDSGYFKLHEGNYKLNIKTKTTEEQRYKTVEFLTAAVPLFESLGVAFKQDLHKKEYFTQKVSKNIKLVNRKDWFDIYGTVQFGEFEIPFIRLKNHILNEVREFELPDGSIALIPEEWFAEFSEVFMFGEIKSDRLELGKIHFASLEKANIEGIDKGFKENISKLLNYQEFSVEIPKNIKAELRPYQLEGYKWMYFLQQNRFGGCLADDMGLGKTLQTIAVLQKTFNETKFNEAKTADLKNKQNQLNLFQEIEQSAKPKRPGLIVMPVSLIHNWRNEIGKFAPEMKTLSYTGINRHDYIARFQRYDLILAGYGIVRNDIEILKDLEFSYLILDESQFIKNSDSKTYKALLELKSEFKLVITGTPVENSLSDLWSQMNFVNPGMLGNKAFFEDSFIKPIEREDDEQQGQKLKRLISPFIMRRTKDEVASDLPPLTEQIIYCALEDEQKSVYEIEKSKMRNKILELMQSGDQKTISVHVLEALTKLRQISNHPVMVDKEFEGESGKFNQIITDIHNVVSENHKVLVFSSFVKHLKLFAEYFDANDMPYTILTGQTKNREDVIRQFQDNPENRIFLISIKAGGTGLNLTEADYVFVIDPWWNPAVEKQAINRAHRLGQDKKVFVYKYISENTIEEKISELQSKKNKLSENIISGNTPFKGMSKEYLLELFD
jgi:SNF2 family DNA or RNA helicase